MSKQRRIQHVLAHISRVRRAVFAVLLLAPEGFQRLPGVLFSLFSLCLLVQSPPAPSVLIYERLSDTCASRIQDNGPEYVRGPGECGCRTPCITGSRPASAWAARRRRHVSFHIMACQCTHLCPWT